MPDILSTTGRSVKDNFASFPATLLAFYSAGPVQLSQCLVTNRIAQNSDEESMQMQESGASIVCHGSTKESVEKEQPDRETCERRDQEAALIGTKSPGCLRVFQAFFLDLWEFSSQHTTPLVRRSTWRVRTCVCWGRS